jgi:hypothetical protein
MLIWWIVIIQRSRVPGYRWHVLGRMQDTAHASWAGNGRAFCWTVPRLQPTHGGRYVFRLREVRGG